MAGDLTIQLGVELDPAGLADIQNQIKNLSNGDNKIKLTIDAKDVESQITSITKMLGEINKTPQKLQFQVDKSSIKEITNVGKELETTTRDLPRRLQMSQDLKLDTGNIRNYREELQGLAEAFSRLHSGKNGTLETQSFKYDSINDAASAVLKYNDALGQTHSVMMKMNDVSSGNGKWQMIGEQIGTSFKNATKEIDNIDNKIKQIDALLNNTKMQGFAAGKSDLFDTTGVNDITAKLEQLKAEYNEVRELMQSGNWTPEEMNVLRDKAADLGEQFKQLASATKIYQDGFKNEQGIQAFTQKVEAMKSALEQYKQKYQEMVNQDPSKASSAIESQISNLQNYINNIDPSNIKQAEAAARELGTSMTQASTQTQTLGQALTSSFGGVGQYLSRFVSTFYLINKAIQTVKSMFNEVKDLNTSMVELSKVTTLSGDSMDNFVKQAYDTGRQLGRTGKDVIDATTTFSRAGYTLDESVELSKSALTMTNIGFDIPDMQTAASDMISIMKAYKIEAKDSMGLIDKLYNVSNKEPLDFGNITDMLVTVGGTMAQTGTSIEQTMGLLTGGFATMRDTSVANG